MIVPADIGLPSRFKRFRSYPGFSQWQTASDIAVSERRFSGIAAPPGTGKSLLAFTASQIMDVGRTLYLTVNKNLQSQLISDFSGSDNGINLYSLVGHSAHKCTNVSFTSHGELLDIECDPKRSPDGCTYWPSVEKSLLHSNVTTNYANWISIARSGDPDRFGKFDLLICDEAHNLESMLCDLLSVKIYPKSVYELIGVETLTGISSSSISNWISWARENMSYALSCLDSSRNEDERYGGRESAHTKRLRKLCENLLTLSQIRCEWVVEKGQQSGFGSGSTISSFTLTPVFASDYAEQWLFRDIPRIILSSATLTKQDFTYLNIGNSSFDYLDIESAFDPALGPFIYWPITEIDYRMVEGQMIQVARAIDQLIDSRKRLNWKGIIHSISYSHAEKIKAYCTQDILTHNSQNKQVILDMFLHSTDPLALASPVLGEGVDFADDRARYQIVYKIPLPDSRQPLIAARKKRDKKYPYFLAAKSILQYKGRLQRSEHDYGETVIFDRNWGKWMMNAVEWPKYFRRSWRRVNSLPEPIRGISK